MRIKICCIKNIREAQLAINAGVSALGLVGNMPSGPGILDDETINIIARSVPPPVSTFLLTSETTAQTIIDHHRRTNTTAIQLVDSLYEGSYDDIRNALPAVKLVQVIHIIDERSINEAVKVAAQVDALLLDSGNPALPKKELGGTGRIHNWELSRHIVKQVDKPVFLAGGLNQYNVVDAIEQVQPFGVDVCSGVRTEDKLDPIKLSRFMDKISG